MQTLEYTVQTRILNELLWTYGLDHQHTLLKNNFSLILETVAEQRVLHDLLYLNSSTSCNVYDAFQKIHHQIDLELLYLWTRHIHNDHLMDLEIWIVLFHPNRHNNGHDLILVGIIYVKTKGEFDDGKCSLLRCFL